MTADTSEAPALRVVRRVVRAARAYTQAGGAGSSGLAQLTELHAANAIADTVVAVALAGTLFFSAPTHQARDRVLLYLLLTMAPFAVVAPVLGPLFDRFHRGRRLAMAVTMLARAWLAWVMADSAGRHAGLALYPAALGVLVLSKAYGVSRSAVVPRVLPENATLVNANARLSFAGLVAAALVAPIAAFVNWAFGPHWTLRLAAVCYVGAAFVVSRLPRRVEGTEETRPQRRRATGWRGLLPNTSAVGPRVSRALRAVAALRGLSGYLFLFLAFLVRTHSIAGLPPGPALGMLAAAAGGGGIVGTVVGSRIRRRAPDRLAVALLGVAVAACVVATYAYSLVTALGLVFVAGFAQALGKLSLDSVIQRDITDDVRTSVFARSETALQLSWVVGGVLGVLFTVRGTIGFGFAAACLATAFVATLRHRPATEHAKEQTSALA